MRNGEEVESLSGHGCEYKLWGRKEGMGCEGYEVKYCR